MKSYNILATGLLALVVVVSVGLSLRGSGMPAEPSNLPSAGFSSSGGNLSGPEPKAEPAPAPAELPVCYELTAEERDLVERVVMAEAGGTHYEGQLAVAQCLLNACVLSDIRPAEAVKLYQYTKYRPEPTESVKIAVAAVFDDGVQILDPGTLFFYAPARVSSAWHESQVYVATVGGHRFFKEAARCE